MSQPNFDVERDRRRRLWEYWECGNAGTEVQTNWSEIGSASKDYFLNTSDTITFDPYEFANLGVVGRYKKGINYDNALYDGWEYRFNPGGIPLLQRGMFLLWNPLVPPSSFQIGEWICVIFSTSDIGGGEVEYVDESRAFSSSVSVQDTIRFFTWEQKAPFPDDPPNMESRVVCTPLQVCHRAYPISPSPSWCGTDEIPPDS